MRVLVDTNILLHAINRDSDRHSSCRGFIEQVSGGVDPWCLTWSIIYEFLRVSTHKSVFPNPLPPDQSVDTVNRLLSSSTLEMLLETEKHRQYLDRAYRAAGPIRGNTFHDCHIASLMLEHDVKYIATMDRHFRLFPFVEIVEIPE
ncbi:MAG: TA system VapC family ribonuclease toxin [Pseudomonadota bacterium]